jgi:hypothetical protein
MICRKVQLHESAPVVSNWEHLIPAGDLPRWKAIGWEECSRERTDGVALSKGDRLIEYFNRGEEPPRPR